jgi:sulfur transfer protein SufE
MSIDDPVLKLETLMDLGCELSPMPGSCASTEVLGCMSRVLICRDNGVFYGVADSSLVRGAVVVVLAMANDGVTDMQGEFSSLNLNLGAGRLNGVDSMIKHIKNMV